MCATLYSVISAVGAKLVAWGLFEDAIYVFPYHEILFFVQKDVTSCIYNSDFDWQWRNIIER